MSIALVSYLEKQIEEKDAIIARLQESNARLIAIAERWAPDCTGDHSDAIAAARLLVGKV